MQSKAVLVGMVLTLAATLAVIQTSSASKAQPTSDLEAGKLSPESSAGYLVVCGGKGTGPGVDYAGFSYVCYAYDITAGTWSVMPQYDNNSPYVFAGRSGMGMTNHRGNIYLAGGYGPGYDCGGGCGWCTGSWYCYNGQPYNVHMYSDVLVYSNKAWKPAPSFDWSFNRLTAIRGDGLGAVSINNTIFVVGCTGGSGGDGFLLGLSFDVGCAAWNSLAQPSICHHYGGVATVGGLLYACGSKGGKPSTYCERYSPSNDTWQAIAPMKVARANFQMVAMQGKLYAVGGAQSNNEFYDPATDAWQFYAVEGEQVYFGAAASDGEKIYLVGGNKDVGTPPTNLLSVYHPEIDAWASLIEYPQSISYASAAFVKSL